MLYVARSDHSASRSCGGAAKVVEGVDGGCGAKGEEVWRLCDIAAWEQAKNGLVAAKAGGNGFDCAPQPLVR